MSVVNGPQVPIPDNLIRVAAASRPSQAAASKRLQPAAIREQYNRFQKHAELIQGLDAIPLMVLVLNRRRQIVFANRATLRQFTGINALLGLRPGELLACVNANNDTGGCGTTRRCHHCGVLRSIRDAVRDMHGSEECRLTYRRSDRIESRDYRIATAALHVDDQRHFLFTLTDIGDEKRKEALERVFLHDILNTASALQGFADLSTVDDLAPEHRNGLSRRVLRLANKIVNEIQWHRNLLLAETGELVTQPVPIAMHALLHDLADEWDQRGKAGVKVTLLSIDASLIFTSDATLLHRILTNLIKNAVEASQPGDVVTLSGSETENSIYIQVHNPGCMPESVQAQVFNRSFSTKGSGRGLGTYSARYFVENYLGGQVSMRSREDIGTVFSVHLPRQTPRHSAHTQLTHH